MRDEDERKVLEKELKRWEETTLRDSLASNPERRKQFVTTSSRPVKGLYTPLDRISKKGYEGLGAPGDFPFTRGIHPTMYRGRLWTMRMFAGYGSAEDTNRRFKYLISHGETGLSVAFDMPTLYGYDTDEVGERRVRDLRRRSLLARRHEDPVPRNRCRRREHVDDHQQPGLRDLGDVSGHGRGPRRPLDEAPRHDPERYPERVPGAEGMDLSPRAVDAARRGHVRVRLEAGARVEHDLDQRVPHPRGGGDGRARARLHPGQRHGVCPLGDRPRPKGRRVRAPSVLLLQRAQRSVRGAGQVSRGPPDLGARDARHLRGEEAAVVAVALPHTDRGRESDGPAAGDQHRPDDDPSDRGGPRRNPVAPHERVRRSLSSTERESRADRLEDSADPRPREWRREHGGPVRRLVLPRSPHERTRGRRVSILRPHRRPGRRDSGDPERVLPAGDCELRVSVSARGRGQGAHDRGGERLYRRRADGSGAAPGDGGLVQGSGGPPPEASPQQGREEACPGTRSPTQGVRGR